MKMRNMIAAVAAMAVSAVAVVAMPASAAEKTIAYTGTAGMGTDNDGVSLRKNILNTWGNDVTDIASENEVADYITVNFTVAGIGDRHSNLNEDGSEADAYFAYLAGSIGSNGSWNKADDSAPCDHVAINGDGTYTVTWKLVEASATIDCLILQSNINLYQFEGATSADDCGVTFTINSIVTDDGVEQTEAPATTTGEGGTTTAGGTTTTAAGTTTAANGGASTTTAASTSNTTTGDNSGIAVAVAALTVAGGVALVSKKRK